MTAKEKKENKRFSELCAIVKESNENLLKLLLPTIELIVNIENQLKELEKIPHYEVNPKNKNQSKITGAGKFYKDLSQMYDNKIKIIQKAISNCDSETQDSFDDWIKSRL